MVLLDDICFGFKEINEIFLKIYGTKTSRKIHLLRNVNEKTKVSSIISSVLIDWLAQRKQ